MGRQKFPNAFADLQRIVPKDMNIVEYYYNTIFANDRIKVLTLLKDGKT